MVRLEDLFRRFPQTPMSVEVKERNEELIHKVVVVELPELHERTSLNVSMF